MSVAISYPGFFETLEPARRVKADKVYLVGFMGAGKTTRRRARSARRLDWQAVDIDELIEQREHLTVVGDLRAARRAVLPRGRARRCSSSSCRTGTSSSPPEAARSSIPQNRAVINRDGVSVWLDVPLERLIARVPADGRRPLAADRAEFERLYQARRAAYEQAHLRLDAGAGQRRRARRADGRLAGGIAE